MMFDESPPPFNDILAKIAAIQETINAWHEAASGRNSSARYVPLSLRLIDDLVGSFEAAATY